jgi:hypothetical protein
MIKFGLVVTTPLFEALRQSSEAADAATEGGRQESFSDLLSKGYAMFDDNAYAIMSTFSEDTGQEAFSALEDMLSASPPEHYLLISFDETDINSTEIRGSFHNNPFGLTLSRGITAKADTGATISL